MHTEEEARAIDHVAERIAARFPHDSMETITALVRQIHRQFDGRPIGDYVPVFVEHAAREQLTKRTPTTAAAIPRHLRRRGRD